MDQTHWIATRRTRPLPTFYYHGHFMEMLDFVIEHYDHVLLEEHRRFVADFRTLPRDAQCLYVRLVNRKGRVFAKDRLRYPELGDQRPLLTLLQERGWANSPQLEHYPDVIGFLTRSEIYDVLLPRITGLPRSLKKAELVDFARQHLTPDEFMSHLKTDRLLVQQRVDEVRYLLFLFFGRVQDGLSRFTMRDLGLVNTQDARDSYEPRFSDRQEARENFYFAERLHAAKSAAAHQYLAREATAWPETNFASSATARDELAFRLGRAAEKAGDHSTAIDLFQLGESARCNERLIRLLLGSDRREEARQHLERCIDNPRSDEEYIAARDIYARKFEKKRTSMVTDVLRAATSIDVDESQCGSPERAAIAHYKAKGCRAYRTENLLWRTLFGLLFWDELFAGDSAATHSPFEMLPASLANNTFYDQHRDAIETKLARIEEDPAAIKTELLKVSTRYWGRTNGLFRWRRSMNDALFALLESSTGEPLTTILRRFSCDYENARYGYPDLLVVDDSGPRFVEIKTDGDQLRRNQLLRINQLRDAGFRADVVRLRWTLDPEQVYVVVDVETTGGRGTNHRVTEIGAVKVRDNTIVDRFQTLLNPQRPIPSSISRLTGITPAMVADAPYFADIVDEFEAFMEDAIFVAHNVDFDYGFVASEFRRIGRHFRYPKLCTCSSMRKLYPGRDSYSLAALCSDFDVPLKQHHRALCDAEAAAELLLLINEKRQAG